MEKVLAGRNALVTGGGVGIGRAIARALAGAGARVAVTYQSHRPDEGFAAEIAELSGAPLLSLAVDMTSPEEAASAAGSVGREFGSVHILVNNVGGMIGRVPVADMDFEFWRRVMAVNLDSTFLATRHVLPYMTSGWGRIVNISSLAGQNGGGPGAAAYATSKAAIFGLTRGLAKELAPRGITVNALAPGFIEDTPFHETFTSSEGRNAAIASTALQRAGTPADVAGAALWLASDAAGFVTGTSVDVNGGQYFA